MADGSVGDALVVDVLAEPTSATEEPDIGEIKMAETPATESLDSGLAEAVAGGRTAEAVIRSSTAGADGLRLASFGVRCTNCELRSQCTDGKEGRTIRVHPHEATLQRSRNRQRDPAWKARYRATRPKVERKIGHLMQRRHGGRRARVRGCARVMHDFALFGAADNLRRLAKLGVPAS